MSLSLKSKIKWRERRPPKSSNLSQKVLWAPLADSPLFNWKDFCQLFSHFLKYLVPVKGKHQTEWFLLLSCYPFLFLMRRSFKLWAGSMNDVTRGRGSSWTVPGKTSLGGATRSSWFMPPHITEHFQTGSDLKHRRWGQRCEILYERFYFSVMLPIHIFVRRW